MEKFFDTMELSAEDMAKGLKLASATAASALCCAAPPSPAWAWRC